MLLSVFNCLFPAGLLLGSNRSKFLIDSRAFDNLVLRVSWEGGWAFSGMMSVLPRTPDPWSSKPPYCFFFQSCDLVWSRGVSGYFKHLFVILNTSSGFSGSRRERDRVRAQTEP